MSDPRVLEVQLWVNLTYSGVSGFNPAPENGKTGWSTVYALTRALQHELGISPLVDNFGAGTASKYRNFGELSPGFVAKTGQQQNILSILKGSMYCKGYDPGDLLGDTFTEYMGKNVAKLQTDSGLSVRDGKVYDYVFKAFLSMDAYVLTPGGDSTTRQIQQELNNKYFRTSGVQPCDGHYQRGTNKALIYGLQTEIGIPESEQTGSIGPATRNGLPTLRQGMTNEFVKLFRYSLHFNDYPTGSLSSTFDSALKNKVIEFQSFTKLGADGIAGKQTWLSALVSTGDPERPGTACDCITEITPAMAQTLKSHGYQTIGRYLVNVPNGLNKKIQPGELETIFDAGLTVFPIFQTTGNSPTYFSRSQGFDDGKRAHTAAKEYGFKPGTVIYFSVDFDAMGHMIDSIKSYFEGVTSGLSFRGGDYGAGCYGPRAVCIEVSSIAGVEHSFVCGMSTGFSGNLGYPLPRNWAFDQIKEYAIGSGEGRIEIDKNIKSGRDNGQSSVNSSIPSSEENRKFFEKFKQLENWASQHESTNSGITDLMIDYLRKDRFDGLHWDLVAGPMHEKAEEGKQVLGLPGDFPEPIIPDSNVFTDLVHGVATADSVILWDGAPVSDFAGWGGDLLTCVQDSVNAVARGEYDNIYDAAYYYIGRSGGSSFSYVDLMTDADWYNIGIEIANTPYDQSVPLYDVVKNYYDNEAQSRLSIFYSKRFDSSEELLYNEAEFILNSNVAGILAIREAFKFAFKIDPYSDEVGRDVARAWKNKFLVYLRNE